jgi:hypothetical protein
MKRIALLALAAGLVLASCAKQEPAGTPEASAPAVPVAPPEAQAAAAYTSDLLDRLGGFQGITGTMPAGGDSAITYTGYFSGDSLVMIGETVLIQNQVVTQDYHVYRDGSYLVYASSDYRVPGGTEVTTTPGTQVRAVFDGAGAVLYAIRIAGSDTTAVPAEEALARRDRGLQLQGAAIALKQNPPKP